MKLAGARTSIIFSVATKLQTRDKNNTCGSSHQKYKTRLLSRQKYAWHDKSFVATKYFCRNKTFVATGCDKYLFQQKYVCRDKHTFVAAKDVFCHENKIKYACGSYTNQSLQMNLDTHSKRLIKPRNPRDLRQQI